MPEPPRYPFLASERELEQNLESFADSVSASLESAFMALPRGSGFVEYPRFQNAYEVLKRATNSFLNFTPDSVLAALREDGMALIVVRTILGLSPSELAHLASKHSNLRIDQGFARGLDRLVRVDPGAIAYAQESKLKKVNALVELACHLLQRPLPPVPPTMIHRLDKADTRDGLVSVRHFAKMGSPYAMLLYERFLGRPFASHRDAVSELIGDMMEAAVESKLHAAGISFRKTKRAEQIDGFDQAPDFIVPDEWNPCVVIEAKLAEDDGTARDKVTRIQHLAELSQRRAAAGQKPFEVVACIDGRGFGVRRSDLRKLLLATRGKVFTLATLDHLIPHTRLQKFATDFPQ